MPRPPTISVIIPVHQGGQDFRQCMESLARTAPRPDQIIVAADGAADGSAETAEQYGAQVVRLPVRGGPSRARNAAAGRAQGDVLFFLDADVSVTPDVVGRVAEIFADRPDLTAVIGSYDDAPGAPNFLSQYKNLLHHFVHQTSCEEASTFWSGCGAIRREVFLQFGGFDQSYRRPSVEDIELGYRLKQAGCRIRLCKALQVKHLKRWTPVSLLRTDFLQRALPWTQLILRDRRLPNDLNLRVSGRVSVLLSWTIVCALIVSLVRPALLLSIPIIGLVLLSVNLPLYRFFRRKRGIRFAIATVPWHWLYFLYSGLAFAVGLFQYLLGDLGFSFYRRR